MEGGHRQGWKIGLAEEDPGNLFAAKQKKTKKERA
jgi:hypothetical protein